MNLLFAQDVETASSGNGGGATASANGGAVATGDVNSGGNVGNAIGVGDTHGDVLVDGGAVANGTNLGITANGGTAIADASGGDYNVAFVS
jgi:formylmethanofuran dehydrogenase subunit C